MKEIVRLVALALVVAGLNVLLGARPAQAVTPCEDLETLESVEQSLCFPRDPGTTLVFEAPVYAWGLRDQARYVEQQVPSLSLVYATGVKCSSYPQATCIRVVKTPLGGAQLSEFDWADDTMRLNSVLNSASLTGFRRRAAGHELLHVLGFWHHSGPGLVSGERSWIQSSRPTPREIATMHVWYDRGTGPAP